MSLAFALMAAIHGSTGSSATLTYGLKGTKPRRRQPGGGKILTAPRWGASRQRHCPVNRPGSHSSEAAASRQGRCRLNARETFVRATVDEDTEWIDFAGVVPAIRAFAAARPVSSRDRLTDRLPDWFVRQPFVTNAEGGVV